MGRFLKVLVIPVTFVAGAVLHEYHEWSIPGARTAMKKGGPTVLVWSDRATPDPVFKALDSKSSPLFWREKDLKAGSVAANPVRGEILTSRDQDEYLQALRELAKVTAALTSR